MTTVYPLEDMCLYGNAPALLTPNSIRKLGLVENREWGEAYRLNNYSYGAKVIKLLPGHMSSVHSHNRKQEVFLCLKGLVYMRIFDLDKETRDGFLRAGDAVYIPNRCKHQFMALEDSVLIEGSTGHTEEDTERYGTKSREASSHEVEDVTAKKKAGINRLDLLRHDTQHPKVWGGEDWLYQGRFWVKYLHLNEGAESSLHEHHGKDETFYVADGVAEIHAESPQGIYRGSLTREQALVIPPRTVHIFRAVKNATIIEISSPHSEGDVFRHTESRLLTPDEVRMLNIRYRSK